MLAEEVRDPEKTFAQAIHPPPPPPPPPQVARQSLEPSPPPPPPSRVSSSRMPDVAASAANDGTNRAFRIASS